MEIEREWGQQPGWFASLARDTQIDLMAWIRVKRLPAPEKGQGTTPEGIRMLPTAKPTKPTPRLPRRK